MNAVTVPCNACGHLVTAVPGTIAVCSQCGNQGPVCGTDSWASSEPKPASSPSAGAITVLVLMTIAAGLAVLLALLGFAWGLLASPAADGVRGANHPRVVLDKRQTVHDDRWVLYSFYLPDAANVELEATAEVGGKVTTYLMTERDSEQFFDAQGRLLGGNFRHYPMFHVAGARHHVANGRLFGPDRYVLAIKEASGANLILNADSVVAHIQVTATP